MLRLALILAAGAALMIVACSAGEDQARSVEDADTAVPTATEALATAAPTSPPPTATPAPASITVLEAGFSTFADESGKLIGSWAAVLQNTDTKHMATDSTVTAIFYGSDNLVLKTEQQRITLLTPGMVSAAGSRAVSLTAKPVRLEVRVAGTKFADAPAGEFNFNANDVVYAPGSLVPSINGTIPNPTNKDITWMQVVCMMVAADGTYSAIGVGLLELMPAASMTVSTCFLDYRISVPAGATARMFPAFSHLTQFAR